MGVLFCNRTARSDWTWHTGRRVWLCIWQKPVAWGEAVGFVICIQQLKIKRWETCYLSGKNVFVGVLIKTPQTSLQLWRPKVSLSCSWYGSQGRGLGLPVCASCSNHLQAYLYTSQQLWWCVEVKAHLPDMDHSLCYPARVSHLILAHQKRHLECNHTVQSSQLATTQRHITIIFANDSMIYPCLLSILFFSWGAKEAVLRLLMV